MIENSRGGNPFDDFDQLIARVDQIARNEELQEKLGFTHWDLVVVDEAHKLSASYFGNELKKTRRFQLGEMLGRIARHFLLMTATPHNGKEEDFQVWLSLLDSDRFYGRPRGGARRVDVSDLMRRMVKFGIEIFCVRLEVAELLGRTTRGCTPDRKRVRPDVARRADSMEGGDIQGHSGPVRGRAGGVDRAAAGLSARGRRRPGNLGIWKSARAGCQVFSFSGFHRPRVATGALRLGPRPHACPPGGRARIAGSPEWARGRHSGEGHGHPHGSVAHDTPDESGDPAECRGRAPSARCAPRGGSGNLEIWNPENLRGCGARQVFSFSGFQVFTLSPPHPPGGVARGAASCSGTERERRETGNLSI